LTSQSLNRFDLTFEFPSAAGRVGIWHQHPPSNLRINHAPPAATNEEAKQQVRTRAPDDGRGRRDGRAGGRLFCCNENQDRAVAAKLAATPSDDEIYTGSILFVLDDGKVCRRFLFDNRSGRLSDSGLVDCESAYYRSPGTPPTQIHRPNASHQ
jgi:hypothetical protein